MVTSDRKPALGPAGTVSRILWHFTGGPTWLEKEQRQADNPKPATQAYAKLRSILKTKEIRLGAYKEIVRVVIPEVRIFNPQTKKVDVRKNVRRRIPSKPICCLSDIPAQHLGYHAQRYGKFAIGFHRSSVVEHGFNPVFYSLEHTGVVKSIYDGLSELEGADPNAIEFAADDIMSAVSEYPNVDDLVSSDISTIQWEVDQLEGAIESARESLGQFVAFIKTFAADEFQTVYCEREWRALKPFRFTWKDVAMIVLPREDGANHFANFTSRVRPRLKLPSTIPVVPWEDLVEH